MSKRRTKEEKKSANYRFLWNLNQSINYTQITSSKKQIEDIKTNQAKELNPLQNSKKVDKYTNNMTFIKKDIVKSLALTTFILALEILLYFVWR